MSVRLGLSRVSSCCLAKVAVICRSALQRFRIVLPILRGLVLALAMSSVLLLTGPVSAAAGVLDEAAHAPTLPLSTGEVPHNAVSLSPQVAGRISGGYGGEHSIILSPQGLTEPLASPEAIQLLTANDPAPSGTMPEMVDTRTIDYRYSEGTSVILSSSN